MTCLCGPDSAEKPVVPTVSVCICGFNIALQFKSISGYFFVFFF